MRDQFQLVMFVVMALIRVVVLRARFVSMEILYGSVMMLPIPVLTVCREGAVVAVVRIVVAIHMAVKIVMTVKPWACSDEYAVAKPLRTVVAVRRTLVRRVVIVAIRTCGLRSNIHAKADLCV